MIYMDNAASTMIHGDVLDAMLPYMQQMRGNPSSIHREGRLARRGVERARRGMAEMINAEPSEIVFTSGGTESNNTVLRNAAFCDIITTQIEHDSVLEPCRFRQECDSGRVRITYLAPDRHGIIQPDTLKEVISDDTDLVSVMAANNEVGTIQPIADLARICHQCNAAFHTDMVQAAGKIPIDVRDSEIDLASFSSHKICGPKGAGALYIRKGSGVGPLIHGGGQEGGMRSGTENVPAIVGFGQACRIARRDMESNTDRVASLRNHLVRRLTSEVPCTVLNGHPTQRLPGNAHLAFLGVNGEDLIIKLDEYGIAASTGSACSVHTQKESHVLRAMGLPADVIASSLRLTLGPDNTPADVEEAASSIKRAVAELRRVSPLREKYGF